MIINGHVLCRNPSCDVSFRPDHSRKIFCCQPCASNVNSKLPRAPLTEDQKQKMRDTNARTRPRHDRPKGPRRLKEERKCVNPICNGVFSTGRKSKRFCSVACFNRSSIRFDRRFLDDDLREKRFADRQAWIMATPFDTLSWDDMRKRVVAEQNSQCLECQVMEWRGQKLSLEVNHKDGNRFNHKRSNLEALCPNCHSITDTWRGRNNIRKKITDQELIEAILETKSLCQALTKVGMAPKGGNYIRAKRLKEEIQPVVGTENSAISTPRLKVACSTSELRALI